MKKRIFLNKLNDTRLRDKLYCLFNDTETEAKSFSASFGNWVPIDKVVQNSNGECKWIMSGSIALISMDPAKLDRDDDLGALFGDLLYRFAYPDLRKLTLPSDRFTP